MVKTPRVKLLFNDVKCCGSYHEKVPLKVVIIKHEFYIKKKDKTNKFQISKNILIFGLLIVINNIVVYNPV